MSSLASSSFPREGGMASFWRSEPGMLDNHRTTESLSTQADIVIVGAGFSGASLVTHLLQHKAISNKDSEKPSIVVLEARGLCSGATGRNGGHVKPDAYNFTSFLANKYGVDAAAEVASFERANMAAVSDLVREQRIDCDMVMTRAMDVYLSGDHYRSKVSDHQSLLDAGMEAARGTFRAPEQHAERLSGVKGAKGMLSFTAGHLWPYKLVHTLFARAVAQGVNLQTHTPATSMVECADGWVIDTPRGSIKATKVIVTTNAYTASLLPEYRDKIIPYRGVVAHIRTPKRAPFLPNTYSLHFNKDDFDYLVPRPDGSIIVGGGRQTYLHNKQAWMHNVNDAEMIEETRQYFDGYMQRHFLGWEDSDAYVSDLWTGIMGYSSDRLPRVGRVPNRRDVFLMAGFTGHGMPQAYLCAKGLAEMVLKGVTFSDTNIPGLFEETAARLAGDENAVEEMFQNAIKAKL